MAGLDLLPLGVGDAFSAVRYSSSYALRAEGRWLLVDCPHPIRKMMREASRRGGVTLDLDAVDTIVLTHLHADHVSGLESAAFFSHFVLRRPTRVAAHPAVSARLWDGRLAAGMDRVDPSEGARAERSLEDYFELVPLEDARAVRVGPFDVECRRTRHHVPTTALRIRAAGRTVAFSADTPFDPELVAWLAVADLVVHETGFGIHTPLERLAELPSQLRARMRVTHVPDTLDVAAGGIEPLEEGRVYSI